LDFRDVEDVVDDRQEMAGRIVDEICIVGDLGLGKLAIALLGQQF